MLNISWNSKTNNKENKVVNDNIAIFSHQIKGENKITIKKVKNGAGPKHLFSASALLNYYRILLQAKITPTRTNYPYYSAC